jgi:hypothetical protein
VDGDRKEHGMSLSDKEHVEVVAVLRAVVEDPFDAQARRTAEFWLQEKHPSPDVYIAALKDALS